MAKVQLKNHRLSQRYVKYMNYQHPSELEFLEREFGLSSQHNPNEAVFSYVFVYEGGKELVITHSPFHNISFSAQLIEAGKTIFSAYQERVSQIAFQTWDDEKIIRVYFKNNENQTEFKVSYFPVAKLYISNF